MARYNGFCYDMSSVRKCLAYLVIRNSFLITPSRVEEMRAERECPERYCLLTLLMKPVGG